jgi:hypothetical protein
METTFKINKTVTLPHYRKNDFIYYKVISETKYLTVWVTENFAKAEYNDIVIDNVFRDGTIEINETEFNDAFNKTIELITTKNQ